MTVDQLIFGMIAVGILFGLGMFLLQDAQARRRIRETERKIEAITGRKIR